MLLQNGGNNSKSAKPQCFAVIFSRTARTDCGIVVLYGIKVFFGNEIAGEYADITENLEKIRELCDLFNKYDIDKAHINDIVEDFADSLHFVKEQ